LLGSPPDALPSVSLAIAAIALTAFRLVLCRSFPILSGRTAHVI
jgi:hypothetical protein